TAVAESPAADGAVAEGPTAAADVAKRAVDEANLQVFLGRVCGSGQVFGALLDVLVWAAATRCLGLRGRRRGEQDGPSSLGQRTEDFFQELPTMRERHDSPPFSRRENQATATIAVAQPCFNQLRPQFVAARLHREIRACRTIGN